MDFEFDALEERGLLHEGCGVEFVGEEIPEVGYILGVGLGFGRVVGEGGVAEDTDEGVADEGEVGKLRGVSVIPRWPLDVTYLGVVIIALGVELEYVIKLNKVDYCLLPVDIQAVIRLILGGVLVSVNGECLAEW